MLANGRRRVETLLNTHDPDPPTLPDDELLDRLEGTWHTLWLEISAEISPHSWEVVQLPGR